MVIALVHEVASFWFDQYQTVSAVPTTMSSGPSPFTSPAPSALIGVPVELVELHPRVERAAGNVLQIAVPVVPNPVKIGTIVPNAIAISRPDCVLEKLRIFTPTFTDTALNNTPEGVSRAPESRRH